MALRERHAAWLSWGEDSVQTAAGEISFSVMVIAFAAVGALVAMQPAHVSIWVRPEVSR